MGLFPCGKFDAVLLLRMEKIAVQTRVLGPLDVSILTKDEAVDIILDSLNRINNLNVAFANTNLVTQAYRNEDIALLLKDFLILNDGIGLEIASKIYHGEGFPDNLNGTDFTPYLLDRLPKGTRVFLYGSKPNVVEKAAKMFAERYDISVVGYKDGYQAIDSKDMVDIINKSKADVVLVAKGNPKQEEWIAENSAELGAPVCIGVGALFDFVAGEFPRAPQWMRRVHLEWLFRLLNEPRRLARRYTLDIIYFMYICWKYSGK